MRALWGSTCSGHASTQARQSMPRSRRHAARSTRGRRVRFAFEMSDTRALMGQMFTHHFRSTSTSIARMAGNRMRPQDVSLN